MLFKKSLVVTWTVVLLLLVSNLSFAQKPTGSVEFVPPVLKDGKASIKFPGVVDDVKVGGDGR